jgi:preprotein translocase subunit SecE
MSALKPEDGRKWINAIVAVVAALLGFVTFRFLGQLSDWFDLEVKIGHYQLVAQAISIAVGLSFFLGLTFNKKSSQFFNEVYAELLKVLWPDKDSTVRLTIGIIIAVAISSGFFVAADLGISKLLSLIY